jgi:nucleotide-binding universal stress UspA family protein
MNMDKPSTAQVQPLSSDEERLMHAEPMAFTSTGNDALQLNTIAQEWGVDLMVPGAYGHSPLREWVLGGVTRDLLLRSDRCSLISR